MTDPASPATIDPVADRPATERGPLLDVRDLRTWFPVRRGVFGRVHGHVRAVDGVSFHVNRGETLGLVGESGCGKTTVGRTLLRLTRGARIEGQVSFDGTDVFAAPTGDMRRLRRRMQMIFQDPFTSLNPRRAVGGNIGEAMTVHGLARGAERRERVAQLLTEVGLDPAVASRYPHEFSGGQRQRIGIARSLALQPDFVVCDEPVSALDVSIQAQIVDVLARLRELHGLSYLFISHDLHVVAHLADRVAVMYLGEIVEQGSRDDLFARPLHPYTRALLSANPEPDPTLKRERIILPGSVPSPANPPSGCRFHTRCPVAAANNRLAAVCQRTAPPARYAPGGHVVRCHLYGGEDGEPGPAGLVREFADSIPANA